MRSCHTLAWEVHGEAYMCVIKALLPHTCLTATYVCASLPHMCVPHATARETHVNASHDHPPDHDVCWVWGKHRSLADPPLWFPLCGSPSVVPPLWSSLCACCSGRAWALLCAMRHHRIISQAT